MQQRIISSESGAHVSGFLRRARLSKQPKNASGKNGRDIIMPMDKAKQAVYNFALTVLAEANKAGDDSTAHAIEKALGSAPAEVLPMLKQAYADSIPRLRQREFEYPPDLAPQVEAAMRQIDSAGKGRHFWFF